MEAGGIGSSAFFSNRMAPLSKSSINAKSALVENASSRAYAGACQKDERDANGPELDEAHRRSFKKRRHGSRRNPLL